MKHTPWLVWLFLIAACAPPSPNNGSEEDTHAWQVPEYAEGFRWQLHSDGSRVLQVLNLESEAREPLIDISIGAGEPFERLACLSTTHLTLLEAGGGLDAAVAGAYLNYLVDSTLIQRVESGALRSLGSTGEPDVEVLIDAQTDGFLSYPFGGQTHQAILEANIPVIPVCEYLETHPLGRAEWMRFLGLLTGNERSADSAFFAIQQAYEFEASEATDASSKPLVFAGSQDGGSWFAPGGESLMATFIDDAGATYLFGDRTTRNNIELDIEVFLERALEADHWGLVIHSSEPLTRAFLLGEEPLLADMPFATQPNGIFACNTANHDYFGRAIVEPHLILSDLKHVFHSDSSGTYYFKTVAP